MVRQWQELFYNEKYSFTDLDQLNPDFARVAQSMGIPAKRVTRMDAVDEAIDQLLAQSDGPMLVEFIVEKEELVFPMVPAGASVSEMILERLNPQRMM